MTKHSQPRIGIGIVIENAEGKILVGKRKGSHAPYYSIPGGSLEIGETFEECIIREVKEETGLIIDKPKVINVSNNLRTYKESGIHFVSINMYTNIFEGIPQLMEPTKCEGWIWVDPKALPQPHFDASEAAVAGFLRKVFYVSK